MSDSTIFQGYAQNPTSYQTSGLVNARFTQSQSLAVAQVEPRNMEMTRLGKRFHLGYSAAVTGIAPVTSAPTTAAQWTIWNPATSGVSLIIEKLGMRLASGTAAAGLLFQATLYTTPANTGSSDTGVAVLNGSGSSGATVTIVKSAQTITTPAAPIWVALGVSGSANATATMSVAVEAQVLGSIIVPPGYGLGLCSLSGAGTTALYIPYGEWIEEALTLV